ncbi:TIGR03885 family FMN-dependent LLM class oxidoreductase [Nostoc ellipsosporum NOK]|nr:TIGR03885 family FMN-dependent LLM class oxidoreductase [Nostoc ellipsosporum NOK]
MNITYHASHEQFGPAELLRLVQLAEQAGFKAIHSSDHFHPWSSSQGQSGFSFSWIAAAMQATRLPFSMVCAPGQRYHPAIVAQAIATLGELFPGRFSIELGSGEALNESITGEPWPAKHLRKDRLKQSAQVIRSLLRGEEVSYGGLIKVQRAKLYSRPRTAPPLFAAALSDTTAAWAGNWADGLITTGNDPASVQKNIKAFQEGGGRGKPVYVQLSFSYGKNREDALNEAFHQWRPNLLPPEYLADLPFVADFEETSQRISREEVEEKVKLFHEPNQLREWIETFRPLHIGRLILHNVSRRQDLFIDACKSFLLQKH